MNEGKDVPTLEAERVFSTKSWALGLAASLTILLWILAWKIYAARIPLHAYTSVSLSSFGPFEGPFYLAATVVELVVFAWVATVFFKKPRRGFDAKWLEALEKPTTAYAGFAFVAFALAIVVAVGVLHLHTIDEDEKTYLFQSWLLGRGRFSVPVPPGSTAFVQPFVVAIDGTWTAQYFWAQPAVLLLGTLVHFPWGVSALCLATTVYFTALLASEYAQPSPDHRAGVVAAALAATSPMLVMTGGTLHNANLSATCGVVSLWALTRLSKEPSTSASFALGISTGVGLHNRVLDHAALLLGAAILLGVRHRRALPALARRLAPAVLLSLPFLALHPLINRAQSGSYWHNGYWLFNQRHGWKTIGFGQGPFGDSHTVASAAAKTFSALVRVAFFCTGCPIGLLVACLPLFGITSKGARGLAPLVVVAVYVTAYFFYAAPSIDTTGPVYYVALVPLLAAIIAVNAVDLFDTLRASNGWQRVVPAVLLGQGVAGILVLWPPQLLQLARAADDSGRCEAVAERASLEAGLVFVELNNHKAATSWTGRAPFAWPPFDAPVLFAPSRGPEEDAKTVSLFAGSRPIYLAKCVHENDPTLLRYDPEHALVGPLPGLDFADLRSPPSSPTYW